MHQERGALGGLLEEASWVEISGDTLHIAFNEKQGFFKEKVESRDNLDYLGALARETAGRVLAIQVRVAGPGIGDGAARSSTRPEEATRERLREAAEKTPIVRTLLDAFNGQIVDVEQA